ncbi:MAG: hypothetical protein H6Q60_1339 [Oscillospiraceae bacterium]|nr:hypothetical protein [Oscillospiraceae bacterium]
MINVNNLNAISKSRKYPKGTIFNRPGSSDTMFILLQGDVVLLDPRDNSIITSVGPGDFFDDSALLGSCRDTITLAVTDVIALPISRQSAADFIAEEPEITLELLQMMSSRFDQLLTDYETRCGRRWVAQRPTLAETPSESEKPERPKKTPAPAAEAQSAPAAKNVSKKKGSAVSSAFPLFPAGHQGHYELHLPSDDREHLMEKEYHCPLCHEKFKALKVRTSKLTLTRTDHDMRRIYHELEPNYYEIVTCPHCLYSALFSTFEKPDITRGIVESELQGLKQQTNLVFNLQPEPPTVFAQYYLALFCAPKCLKQPQLSTAKLFLKLSWIYHDCGDQQMETEMLRQALDAYMDAHIELQIPESQEQQLCMIMGEICFKLGDFKKAREYYHKAKINRAGTPVLQKQAEDRMDDIKSLMKQNAAASLAE